MKKQWITKILSALLIVMLALGALPVTPARAAAITSVATGTWAATAWPNTTRTGNITTSNVSTTVTGTGTLFTTEISVGNIIKTTSNVVIGTVASITNNTTLVLTSNAASSNAGIAFNSQGVGSGDTVTIASGHVVTVSANSTVSSLTLAAAATANGVTISGANTLTVTNAITINAPTANVTSTVAVGTGTLNAGSISIIGSATNNFDAILSVSTGTINSAGAIDFSGTANQAQLNITGTGPVNAGSLTGAGTIGLNNPSNINLTGDYSFTGALSNANRLNLTLNGTGAQTVNGTNTFRTLIVNKASGTATAGAAITINNVGMTVTAGTLDLSTYAHTGAGTLTVSNGATLRVGGTETLPTFGTNTIGATSAIVYYGTAQTVRAQTYGNLVLSGSGTKTAGAAYTVTDTLTIGAGTTLDENTRTLTMPEGASLIVNGTLDFTSSTGLAQCTSGTCTVTMGANGLIRTVDALGLGPVANASLVNNGGTWTTTSIDTNGTVEYYLNAAQVVTDRNYNNLTITSAGTKTWTIAATRTVNGNVTINSGAPLTLSGAQTVNVSGNWTNNGGTFTAGTGTVTFNGSAAQTIGGTTATTFNNLTIGNAAGVSLNAVNATVNNTLALGANKLTTGANTLIMALATGVITRTTGFVEGNLQKPVAAGAPTIAFEVGTGTSYAPISTSLTGASAGGTLTGSATAGLHPNYATSGLGATKYINRYWTLTPAGFTFTNYNSTFTFVPGDLVGAPNTSALLLRKYNAGWTAPPGGSSSTATTVTGNGYTTFSDFAGGETGNTAPTVSIPIADVNVLEDAANTVFSLYPNFEDAENTDAQLTYTVQTNTNSGLFTSVSIADPTNFTLDYAPDANGTSNITIRATDTGGLFVEDTFLVTVTAVNDAPVLAAIEAGALAYTENQAATAITATTTVTDVDSANLTGATIQITTNYQNGQDVLAFANQLGITGAWTAATGTMTLSGATTVANYQTAIRAVTYQNTSDNPITLARAVNFTVTDGTANSNTATRNITVTAVNDAPVVTDIPDQTIAEGASFATVNLDDFVSDVDNTDAQMTWTYSGNTDLSVSIVARVATISIPNAD